ncbi:MAG: DNA repair protein RadA [Deltaproteobacteria bacterium]
MKKSKPQILFACQNCGSQSPKWLGKCPACGEWNSYVEERADGRDKSPAVRGATRRLPPTAITKIETDEEQRIQTGMSELDRVLGGGFVEGSIALVGGDPGIGKSTLAIQMLHNIASVGMTVLYVTGEESPRQVKLRAERLSLGSDALLVFSETSVESIIEEAAKLAPKVAVIDSIQTVYSEEFPSAAGSVGQIRECASKLMQFAKTSGTAIFLVGHVTKEGAIAGPKVLEHLVDTVLYFEGGRDHPYRILRAIKNRFGSTNEIGVFEMRDSGLEEVKNPSEIFLSERPKEASGSVVTPSLEGTRPILVEIQALVSPCNFGMPRRTAIGLEASRVALLVAVLEKRAGLHILGQDIFMNVAGGVKIEEPAVDLAISAAIISSFVNKPLEAGVVVFGEVGLSGEIRGVSQVELRLKEAQKLGFTKCVLPKINLERIKRSDTDGLALVGAGSIEEAIDALF